MCSIFGAVASGIGGAILDEGLLAKLRENARDRGRDGGRMEYYEGYDFGVHVRAALGNWRATPTPELAQGRLQPYGGMVHNGTIANDEELGKREGEIDSEVLARVIDRRSALTLAESLKAVVGSWALAAWNGRAVLLSTNYKPLYYARIRSFGADPDEQSFYFSSMARHFDGLLPRGVAPAAVAPYSTLDLLSGQVAPLAQKYARRALVICSAGLDSTVVATKLVREGWDVTLIHFAYGCRAERRETRQIPLIAERLGCRYVIMPLSYSFAEESSPLLRDGAPIAGQIAGAEYAHEWVPARNLLFMSLAAAYAEARGYHALAIGINLEEAGAFPDNEEEFTLRFNALLPFATQNGYRLELLTPVGNLMKHEIVRLGLELEAPLDLTWSCYRAGEHHCGECGPCFMRREAHARNGVVDPVFAEAPK
jgi:7-cyano-7-deazaguanine synthase